jgi:ADP-heptose:LPS heptosyltransferase
VIGRKPGRILVYRTGHLGDTVCAIPAFRLIRGFFPDAELALLCDRPKGLKVAVTDVIGSFGIFENIITYTSNRHLMTAAELGRKVRKIRPDMAIILPQVRENAEMLRRKKRFFKHCGVSDIRGQNFPALRNSWQPNEPTRLIQILHSIGVRGPKPAYELPRDLGAVASVKAKLQAAGVDPGRPYLVFCGGGKEPTQRWSLIRYAHILKTVKDRLPISVVAIGNLLESINYQAQIVPECPELRFPGQLSLPELFEMLRGALAYFGNDTGPMHVAAAVKCPVAAVISARNSPGAWDPDVQPSIVFRHRTECEDCFLGECVVERHRCMTGITEEAVRLGLLEFLSSLLSGASAPNRERP